MNMNAPKTENQSKLQETNQEIKKDEEQIEMRVTSNISKVKTWVSQSLATHRSVKLMGGVALGALMITVTGLQFAPSQTERWVARFGRITSVLIGVRYFFAWIGR